MKDFLKMTGAVIVGLLITSVITFFISFSMIGAIMISSTATKPEKLNSNTVMKVSLNGVVAERSEKEEMEAFMRAMGEDVSTVALDELRAAFRKAAKSKEVKAVLLDCGIFQASPASIEEIRDMIARFKQESGKPVYSYADSYLQGAYWTALGSDDIMMNPQGSLLLSGITMNTMFYHEALEKLGVEMQVFKVGTFKSAVEPYILDGMSDANRLQMQKMADNIWGKIKTDAGNLPVQEYADEGGFLLGADYALNMGMVTKLIYRQDVNDFLDSVIGGDVKLVSYKKVNASLTESVTAANTVAVLYANGAIDGGGQYDMNSKDIVKELNKLADNDKVKAVVLRVNSPGGSAFGSEQMWYAAKMLKQKKPLIVSMGDYAASGGYYMSCIADSIVAQPTTLTGSIGIFGLFPTFGKLFDKVGLSIDGVNTAKYADFGNTSRPCTEGERMLMQKHINQGYELFVSRCAEGRGMTCDEIKKIAEGRVWTGADAKELGLVDELGGLDKAIEIAAEKAGLGNYRVAAYPAKKDFMTQFVETLGGDVSARIISYKLGDNARWYDMWQRIEPMQGIQALMPYQISVN